MTPLDPSWVLAVKPTLRIESLDASTAFLIGERERFVLAGDAAVAVASLVDGHRTIADILDAARATLHEPEVLYALHQLVECGHLVRAGHAPCSGSAFWYGMGLDGNAAAEMLRVTPVAVVGVGDAVPVEWLTEALRQAGVRVDRGAAVQVVVTDDYLRPELASINRAALLARAPWFLVQPTGLRPLVGPAFRPGAGACWDCLAFWIRQNQPVEELVRQRAEHEAHGRPVAPRTDNEAGVRAACGIAALAIASSLVRRCGTGDAISAHVLGIDLAGFAISPHAVVQRPQCATCGDPARTSAIGARPIELQRVAKPYAADGGYRRDAPRRTYERYQHLVSPVTGAVTHLVPMPARDTELRAVYASGYLVCPRNGGVPRRNVFDKRCAGKGRSADQARVSALCEALERFSGVYQGDEPRVRGSLAELGTRALPVSQLVNFSEAQYGARQPLNARTTDRRQWIPAPIDRTTAIDWTPAWSLTRQERRYVPFPYCYAEAPVETGTPYCDACSNGVAAGACLEEAILQALLELVERDAAAIWWYNRLRRPAIDLDSFADPYFDALRADYAGMGWTIWVLDLTHDLGISTCVALAYQASTDRFAIGFGCHLDPRIAVQRSLTELNQVFDPTGTLRAPWDLEQIADRSYLFPDNERTPIAAETIPQLAGADLRADIEQCSMRLERAGLELVVVDKTRPDIGLHVAQVIVPGLRHFWPRFGPGRLYEVPCALGWTTRALEESELNPVPLFV